MTLMGLLRRIDEQKEKAEREAAEARGETYHSKNDPNRPVEPEWRRRAKENALPTWTRTPSGNGRDYGRDESNTPL